MTELKTKPNKASVEEYLDSVKDPQQKVESFVILDIMKEITGEEPVMWGNSIIGFGKYHYKYKSGRKGDWFLTGFAPRKGKFSLYITPGFTNYEKIMERLGKYKTGVGCLYIKKLDDVNMDVLKELIEIAVEDIQKMY